MRDESNQDPERADPESERLVVIEVLESKDGYTSSRLERKLSPVSPEGVRNAVASLERIGVVDVKRTRVHPSAALRRIDELGLICI
jgi:Mn-dependent DtxR family transcriptional regulator